MDQTVAWFEAKFKRPRWKGWEVYDPQMGSSCLLLCPCGTVIEQDGECPEGHVSPMVTELDI